MSDVNAPAKVDVLAVIDDELHIARRVMNRRRVESLEQARATVANLIAERDALHWALAQYPKRNTHRLQAQKICDGVLLLAVARIGGDV